MNFSVIIVAAGSSQRMGFDKLLASLAGKPVLQHSIEAFANCPNVAEIIVVCPIERYSALRLELSDKRITRVDGGTDRHDSVAAGLSKLTKGAHYIAVHDGARPLISCPQIENVLKSAVKYNAASSARPVTETIKRANTEGFVTESLCRDQSLADGNTPNISRPNYSSKPTTWFKKMASALPTKFPQWSSFNAPPVLSLTKTPTSRSPTLRISHWRRK